MKKNDSTQPTDLSEFVTGEALDLPALTRQLQVRCVRNGKTPRGLFLAGTATVMYTTLVKEQASKAGPYAVRYFGVELRVEERGGDGKGWETRIYPVKCKVTGDLVQQTEAMDKGSIILLAGTLSLAPDERAGHVPFVEVHDLWLVA